MRLVVDTLRNSVCARSGLKPGESTGIPGVLKDARAKARGVFDTNIIIAALIRNASCRKVLSNPDNAFLIPDFTFEEVERNKEEIIGKSGLSEGEFNTLLLEIREDMEIVPSEEIRQKEKAREIMDKIDAEDTIFIALALSTSNDGIWSDDKHFKKQNIIKVYTTTEIIEMN